MKPPAARCASGESMSLDRVNLLHPSRNQRSTSSNHLLRNRREELRLRPTILSLSFEFSKKVNVQQEIMKKYSALTLIVALAFCLSQSVQAQANKEAAKFAREGAEASKNQDWEKAIDLFRKATDRDRKFAPNLAVAYQQRGVAAANDQKFQDAIRDFSEAIKINSRDARIYEQRAAEALKTNDFDKALADYSEAIKLSPDEVGYYLYRGYIYERKGEVKNSMPNRKKARKLNKHNAEA